MQGDFKAAEHIISVALNEGAFREYMSNASYKPLWKKIHATDPSLT